MTHQFFLAIAVGENRCRTKIGPCSRSVLGVAGRVAVALLFGSERRLCGVVGRTGRCPGLPPTECRQQSESMAVGLGSEELGVVRKTGRLGTQCFKRRTLFLLGYLFVGNHHPGPKICGMSLQNSNAMADLWARLLRYVSATVAGPGEWLVGV
jgi:hypothetical protein